MKLFLSINNKFFEKTPYDLISYIKKYDNDNVIKGFEIHFDLHNEFEKKYIENLLYLMEKVNYDVQFHGNSNLNIEEQYKYMDYMNLLSKVLKRKIHIVLHPLVLDDYEESMKQTNIYFSKILIYIYSKKYDINISIENLSTIGDIDLSKKYISRILANNSDLYFTYDVGHEIKDYGNITNLNYIQLERLYNVHIHSFNMHNFNTTYDHQPIFENDDNITKIVKTLKFLKLLGYQKTIVLEYDFYALGNQYEERIINYLKSANYINSHL